MEDAIAARQQTEQAGAALQTTLQRFYAILSNMYSAILLVTDEGRVEFANHAFCDRFGLDDAPADLVGLGAADMIEKAKKAYLHPDEAVARIHEILDRGQPVKGEEVAMRDGGACLRDFVPLNVQGRSYGRLWHHFDISDRKQAEEALQKAAEELARSNKDLDQFASVASHDLQEPLRTVAGFVQLLRKEYGDRLDAKADSYIGYTVDGVKRMQALIHDLLVYARVGTRSREPVPIDAGTALGQALDNLHESIQAAGAEITHGQLPTVRADLSQLAQLFQNLLGNALKFRSQAPPKIHVDACREGDYWRFSVRDNGIGIDAKFQEQIFEVFRRLHTRKQYTGTGIGLAICKKIVDRHGGRIWVESEPGQGATFHFTIPT